VVNLAISGDSQDEGNEATSAHHFRRSRHACLSALTFIFQPPVWEITHTSERVMSVAGLTRKKRKHCSRWRHRGRPSRSVAIPLGHSL
jgi:hypothetical protein